MTPEEAAQAASDLYPVLSDILVELQAVRADMSGLASRGDMVFVCACLLFLAGVVIGAVAAVCVGRWSR